MTARPETVAFFRAAASYLARADLRCPVHRVAHTGKLARAVVLDLALFDATGEMRHWDRAVARARWVASRLAPDPEHGGSIYFPGRLDPRNCSNSVIDSGECTDALARVLLHSSSTQLNSADGTLLRQAVERNAETYLRAAVVEKEITNQRLWGAMGLASAHAVFRRATWRDALAASLARSIDEQHPDGSWPYQPSAQRDGAHAGAADISVYYQSRCLAFLLHVADFVPEVDTAAVRDSLRRGLEFLALVTTPDGLKPLALEGKRWFWDGSYEAGSAAFDLFALLRGAARLERPDWRVTVPAAWAQLRRHQRADGSIRACLDDGRTDFVCPDFHTADLSWTVQLMGELDEVPLGGAVPTRPNGSHARDAGIVRVEGAARVAVIRTTKAPSNSQFGGEVGGGTLAAVVTRTGERLVAPGEAVWNIFPPVSLRASLASVRRFAHENPPGREGRQWLFVARTLLAARQPLAAVWRLWRGAGRELWRAARGTLSSSWACDAEPAPAALGFVSQLTDRGGNVPPWARDVLVEHRIAVESHAVAVSERISGSAPPGTRLEFVLPAPATAVEVRSDGIGVTRRGARLAGIVGLSPFRVDVTYAL